MATSTDQKPRPVTGTESDFDRTQRAAARPEVRINQTNQGSGNSIAYIIAALVVLVGAYYLYTSYYSPTVMPPTTTEIAPAPAPATPPAAPAAEAPASATPPAATAPAADVPVVPAPATPPATTP